MSSLRQRQLFAAEDWRKIYKAYSDINFSSYDFDTIRESLVTYLREKYPEDFNDYVENSEFIAIVDTLAYLSQSIAFRMDLNTRENFIDTAERKDSVLKLAQFLSYQPKRNIPARGLLKIDQIQTNDDVVDSNGTNLNGRSIRWNDENNPDWREQFNLVMNNALVGSNPIGQPVQQETLLDGKQAQLYRLNNSTNGQYPFSANVDGLTYAFEIVNVKIENGRYVERTPMPTSAFHIVYQNDGLGNASAQTGFFTYIKQGTLGKKDYLIDNPRENRVIEYSAENVNELDVWVQTIDSQETGNVITEWTKVPALSTSTVIYNSVSKNIRTIYSVLTGENQRIKIRFSDGRFGEVPTGILRTWYRTSANANLSIRPQDIKNESFTISYINPKGLRKTLLITCSLKENITNGSVAETLNEIRTNAPQVYYTQDRMVSGEDYNSYPLSIPGTKKIKVVNRTFVGHSRYIDDYDPTARHNSTLVYSDDGYLYKDVDRIRSEVSGALGLNPREIINSYVLPLLSNINFENWIYDVLWNNVADKEEYSEYFGGDDLFWQKSTETGFSSTGVFVNDEDSPQFLGDAALTGKAQIIKPNSLIRFENAGWVKVLSVESVGNFFRRDGSGAVILAEAVETGDKVLRVIPNIRRTLTNNELSELEFKIQSDNTFILKYDIFADDWITENEPDGGFNSNFGEFSYNDPASGWYILFQNNLVGSISNWVITIRGSRFIFESKENVRFYEITRNKTSNVVTGEQNRDYIEILSVNKKREAQDAVLWQYATTTSPVSYKMNDIIKYMGNYYRCVTGHSVTVVNDENNELEIYQAWLDGKNNFIPIDVDQETTRIDLKDLFRYQDGAHEPRRVQVGFTDMDEDGVVDNPTIFDDIIFGLNTPSNDSEFLIHFGRFVTSDGYNYFQPIEVTTFQNQTSLFNDYFNNREKEIYTNGNLYYLIDEQEYWLFDSTSTTPLYVETDTDKYYNRIGRKNLSFLWKHFAKIDERIDISKTNIMDAYVLTGEYDTAMRLWLADAIDIMPKPPTVHDLRITYGSLENVKMMSDSIVWHPVKYKLLFGRKAPKELQATIKITKLPEATMSDGEIKATVIQTINKYFAAEYWNFGETMYFTELSTYIHQTLATQVAGVVLVPSNEESAFGDLYEIRNESDEIPVSCATVDDVEIVPTFTNTTLRIR